MGKRTYKIYLNLGEVKIDEYELKIELQKVLELVSSVFIYYVDEDSVLFSEK